MTPKRQDAETSYWFRGFRFPAYTQTPNELFDELAPRLTEAELRVLLYVVRRTFGFHKQADAISLSQMTGGITTANGEALDHGTGMSRSAVWRGAKGLVEKGVLTVDRLKHPDGEYETNVYHLRFAEDMRVSLQENYPISPREQGVGAQEREQKTSRQKKAGQKSLESSNGISPHVDKYDGDRLALLPYAQDLAREFNDQAPLASTTTRLVNLYRASGLELETFLDRMMQSRAITQERTGAIRGRSEGLGPKPKMAYFLSVLEDLAGRSKAPVGEGG